MISRDRSARLTAALTGQGRAIGPTAAHEANVIAITRRIHKATARRAVLNRGLKALRASLRADRRELRAVLQRSSTINLEALDAAGPADGSIVHARHIHACAWAGWIPEDLESVWEKHNPSEYGDDGEGWEDF